MKNHKKKNRSKLSNVLSLLLLAMPYIYSMDGKKVNYQQRIRTLSALLKTHKKKKIDLNKPYGSEPPLIQSVIDDSMLEITKALLQEGAQANILDKQGRSPLTIAIEHHAYETAHMLLNAKADANKCRTQVNYLQDKNDPIHILCSQENNNAGHTGQLKLLDTLLKTGVNPNSPNGKNIRPLHASLWDLARMKVLLDHKADPNMTSKSHYSNDKERPLYILCATPVITQRLEKIALLLSHGANPNLGSVDLIGKPSSPLSILRSSDNPDNPLLETNKKIADILIGAGAFINLSIAYKSSDDLIAKYLRQKYPREKRIAQALAFLFKRSSRVGAQPLPRDVLIIIGRKCTPDNQAAASGQDNCLIQ